MHAAFRGHYHRFQNERHTLALIAAGHRTPDGKLGASLQVITPEQAWNVPFPAAALRGDLAEGHFSLGESRFSPKGLRLCVEAEGLTLTGALRFGALTPPRYDVMGPLALLPALECRHHVYSLYHSVDGVLRLNDRTLAFCQAAGYWEGDSGRTFPREYLWVQHSWLDGGPNALFLAAARVPLPGLGLAFPGVVALIRWRGREYRLASYLGARVRRRGRGELLVRQGRWSLLARRHAEATHALPAPAADGMTRLIRESPSCPVSLRFAHGDEPLFAFTAHRAACEWEYNDFV